MTIDLSYARDQHQILFGRDPSSKTWAGRVERALARTDPHLRHSPATVQMILLMVSVTEECEQILAREISTLRSIQADVKASFNEQSVDAAIRVAQACQPTVEFSVRTGIESGFKNAIATLGRLHAKNLRDAAPRSRFNREILTGGLLLAAGQAFGMLVMFFFLR
jgi:hypothetical protein